MPPITVYYPQHYDGPRNQQLFIEPEFFPQDLENSNLQKLKKIVQIYKNLGIKMQ